jgi:hypothetical protein
MVLVIFPLEQQLRIEDRTPQSDLVAFANAEGIPVLDLYDAYQPRWREGLYFDHSQLVGTADKLRPNEAGHTLAAREIASLLLSDPDRFLMATPRTRNPTREGSNARLPSAAAHSR